MDVFLNKKMSWKFIEKVRGELMAFTPALIAFDNFLL